MRRIILSATLLAIILVPAVADAKLPFFGLDVDPLRPDVGEPITLTMSCFEDMAHTQPWGSCLGSGGRMAWVHPLDDEGRLDRDDWIMVEGYPTSSGATRGRITLGEAGSYDVLPLWRTWGPDAGDGFPGVIRIEVGRRGRTALTAATIGMVVVAGLGAILRRRRAVSETVTR